VYTPFILKKLKLFHHIKGKLKGGKVTGAAGYVENSLAMWAL